MNNTAQPVPPKPAATIILLRDGNSGLEVLILRKASGKHFASGALVFPGGKVDAADLAFAGDIGEKRNALSDFKIAAIREMYEECGIALARITGTEKLLDATGVA
ncbi:MAG: NUDIX domain-containing protein, partial [Rhodospirillales bacterium]|nr:NUDIX domain-containing protein [Rhodospirillales bacterium]